VSRSDGVSVTPLQIARDVTVPIRTIGVKLGRATPSRLRDGVLPPTYTAKPLVSVGGDGMFGELAIVRLLEADGWEAVWVDTLHGRKFWRAMPNKSDPVSLPSHARAHYDAILAENGDRASGFFNVMAWRDAQYAHLNYETSADEPNRNEIRWVNAALRAGVTPSDLWIVRGIVSRDAT
jgi:hypothetical protein